MSGADITAIRELTVRVSDLHRRARRYRDGFVDLFREVQGALVLTDDGEPLTDGRGRVFVTPHWFASEMGIASSTFDEWLNGRVPRVLPDTGNIAAQCSCIPDPGCPVHGRE